MSIHLALEAGSTHNGKFEYAKELIEIAAGVGASSIKFQLFPDEETYTKDGNVPLPYGWWPRLHNHAKKKGIKIAASVFDKNAVTTVVDANCPADYIKFAYSKQSDGNQIKALLKLGKTVVVSTNRYKINKLPEGQKLVKLACYTHPYLYYVPYEISFENTFPPFDGFSDHTLGYWQAIRATEHGAAWIEKHITLKYSDITCPDRYFALTAQEAGKMIDTIRRMWP